MSKVGKKGRSYKPITRDDLGKLLKIAKKDRLAFFRKFPRWKVFYAKRVLCIALCQGAAQHYVDGTIGINDFDVYTFYRRSPRKKWYAKRIKSYDFGDDKFGRSVDEPDFVGRRVDCLSRAIDNTEADDPSASMEKYLLEKKTKTAKLLAKKACGLT
jgi:hypothetical protein